MLVIRNTWPASPAMASCEACVRGQFLSESCYSNYETLWWSWTNSLGISVCGFFVAIERSVVFRQKRIFLVSSDLMSQIFSKKWLNQRSLLHFFVFFPIIHSLFGASCFSRKQKFTSTKSEMFSEIILGYIVTII